VLYLFSTQTLSGILFSEKTQNMIRYGAHIRFLLFTVFFFTAAEFFAADGDLDTTFDGDGVVITDNGNTSEGIVDLLIQPDRKIIAVGYSINNSGMSRQSVIIRYNSDGSLDSTFGAGGKVFIPSSSPLSSEMALQPDGKIVFVGTIGASPNSEFYVARLNADGSFDAAFNGTGAVTLDLRGTTDFASSVKIQPDGKIVIGGVSHKTSQIVSIAPPTDFTIVRLNTDGSLDTTFDGDGKVFTSVQEVAGISSLAIQPDGKIVAAGEAFTFDVAANNPANSSFTTVRYNSDGSLDTTFNGTGIVSAQFVLANATPGSRKQNRPDTIIIRPGGKILVVGNAESCCVPQPLNQVAMVQYNADGSVDSSFGNAGKIQIGFTSHPTTRAIDAAIQPDNKIVITGDVQANHKARIQALVGRFNANGSLDATFSGDGWNTFSLSSNVSSRGNAVAIQPDGKIIIGGYITGSNGSDFMLARFEASSCKTANCSGEKQKAADFDGDGRTDLSVFRDGIWFINPSGEGNPNSFYGVQFGLPTDKLTPADFDGDGKTDIAVWRENVQGSLSYFYILQSFTNTLRIAQFGQTGDDPRVVGDWDGDGKADLTVYRGGGASAEGQSFFFYRPSSQTSVNFAAIPWGTAGDDPLRTDFDGDGRVDATVFRPSDGVWYILQSSNNQPRFAHWGLASDKRISGDFDGDGKTDLAVYRNGLWAVLQSSNNQARYIHWGLGSDRIVAGDYDGDGRTDFAVWRAGVYYIRQNSNAQAAYNYFGVFGDIPVASVFVR
jgi:uncharacterized delta-60 repeat protein